MKGGRVHWYYDSLTPRLRAFPLVVDAALGEVMQELAEEVEEYMRTNAPWNDLTGEARGGLTAEAVDDGLFQHAIVIYHTVEYGIWLEIRWNGRYAILVPTIEHYGPIVMSSLGGAFDRG